MSQGMPCRTARECLGDYLDSSCPDIVRERVEAHLLECKDCSRHLSELEYVELRLKKALVPMEPSADFSRNLIERLNDEAEESWGVVEEPSESFTATVMGRIQEELQEEAPRRNWKPLLRAGVLLAATLLVALGVILFQSGVGRNQLPEEGATASLFQVESLDGRALLLNGPSLKGSLGLGLDLEEAPTGKAPAAKVAAAKAPGREGSSKKAEARTPAREASQGKELQPGNPIPLGKEVLVLKGEIKIRARASQGGTLLPGWKLEAEAGSRVAFEEAGRSTLRKGRLRISESREEGSGGSFFLGFPGGGGILIHKGKVEVDVRDDPWAVAAGLPGGASKIQVDLEEGEGVLVGVSGNPIQKLLPGDRALMRPFEPLRISHGVGVQDILAQGADPLRSAQTDPEGLGSWAEVGGRLQSAVGAPLSGIDLRLVLPQQSLRGRTSPSGTFHFRPEVGDVVLGAFLAVEVSGTNTVLRFELPPLRPGARMDLTLTLPQVESLPARILDAEGAPLVSAKLRLFQWEPLLKRLVSLGQGVWVTGPAGRVRFGGLPLPQVDQRILLVVEPRDAPLFVGYLDRAAFLRLQREGGEWILRSPKLTPVLLEAPGVTRVLVEERPQGPARDMLLRKRELPVVGGRVRVMVVPQASAILRWWTQDAEGARVHEGRVVAGVVAGAVKGSVQGPRVLIKKPQRLQIQVLDARGEGASGLRFVLLRRKDGLPVLFGKTAKGGFANLLLVDSREDLELRVSDQGRTRSFDLPPTGDLLVARLSFGRIAQKKAPSETLAREGGDPGFRLVGPLRSWRPFAWKTAWKTSAWKTKGPKGENQLGSVQLSLSAGGGARVVPSARVYLLSEDGGLALLGTSDLLGQVKVVDLPVERVLRLLVVHPVEGAAMAELKLRSGETRRMLLELHARKRVGGALPKGKAGASGARFVEVEILGGPFGGIRTVAIPGADGRLDLKDLPAGESYRFRYGGYEARLNASGDAKTSQVLRPDLWKPVAK